MLTLKQLNQLSDAEFVTTLAGIFEHSAWVAQRVLPLRPFASVEQLHHAMSDIVLQSSREERLALIRSHPQLAGKEAERGKLTEDSRNEQAGARLNHCSAEELKQLRALNQQYLDKFGFPFVIAVKGLNRYDILQAMNLRIQHNTEDEFTTSLEQIARIAEFRLKNLIQE